MTRLSFLTLQGTTLQLQGITLPPSLLTSQGRSLTDGALVGVVKCLAGVGLVDVGAVALLPDATVGLEFGEAAACRAALGAKVGEAVGVAECSPSSLQLASNFSGGHVGTYCMGISLQVVTPYAECMTTMAAISAPMQMILVFAV